ncbi:alkaline phosphatase family protein [Caldinitratiruptor microaerophilus]|uniref:Type I phosphodiesterase / nucleotide pyrophosphatase n=1 Tax=Caldinitratiruptor microaerophilus TaxID=671077 RepID=A0AA35CN57_9FIRM|nr:hypothetical protein [Caldinitratiruptor microaerophilus]BDG61453.1 hypothetical protein caldi_25430 [Caldinitratiruptor microaerophilus]
MKRALAFILLLSLAGLAGTGAVAATRTAWRRLAAPVRRAGAHEGIAAGGQAAGAPPKPAEPLVLVLVDGLDAAAARRLPTFDYLARAGGFATVEGPSPDWPVTAWATVLTGEAPADHGRVLPSPLPPLAGPNLVATAREMGVSVALAGEPAFLSLLGAEDPQEAFPVPPGWSGTGSAFMAAARSALGREAHLTVIQIGGLHAVAHDLGRSGDTARPRAAEGADGPPPAEERWAEALGWLDARLAAVAGQIDLSRTTLVVLGTFASGPGRAHGRGDPVPLAAAGPGHAALLRTPPTSLAEVGRRLAGLAGVPSPPPRSPAAQPALAGWAAARWELVRPRLPWVAAGLFLGGLYLLLALRSAIGRALLAGLLTYHVAYYALFAAFGGRLSTALPALEGLGFAFWRDRAAQAGGAALLAAAVTGVRLGREGSRPRHAALGGIHLALVIWCTLALQALPVLLVIGWDGPVTFPGTGWTVKLFLDLIQGAFVGLGAPVWAGAAGVAAAIRRRLSGAEPGPVPVPPRGAAGIPVSPHHLGSVPVAASRMRPSGRRPARRPPSR